MPWEITPFSTLENQYLKAVGRSIHRKNLLYILAHQQEHRSLYTQSLGGLNLRKARKDAFALDVTNIDRLMARLIDPKHGPVLRKIPDVQGHYECIDPIFRIYCQLRELEREHIILTFPSLQQLPYSSWQLI